MSSRKMETNRDTDGGTDNERYAEKLSDISDDGDGCTEMWETMSSLRRGSERDHRSDRSPSRRAVLAGLVGSVVTLPASLGGIAAAYTDRKEVKQVKNEHNTPEKSRSAFEKYGFDVLQELSDADYIDMPSFSEFRTHKLLSATEYRNRIEGMHLTSMKLNDVYTAYLTVSKETPTHWIEVNIFPQLERTYAIVEAKSDAEVNVVDPDSTSIGPTSFCGTTTCCGASGCSLFVPHFELELVCCVRPDGSRDCYIRGGKSRHRCCRYITC